MSIAQSSSQSKSAPRARLYKSGTLVKSDFPIEQVSDYLAEPDTHVWLDLASPEAHDFELLAEEFGLHELAIEDATKPHQRPKVEVYENHAFMVLYWLEVDERGVRASEVDAFVSDRYLITVRKSPEMPMDEVLRRWDVESIAGGTVIGNLVHGLLDTVVDDYFDVVEKLEEQVENFQQEVLREGPATKLTERMLEVSKMLTESRRRISPVRQVMATLLRREDGLLGKSERPYFQDVADHVERCAESLETLRESMDGIFNVHLSLTSNALNTIMKKITGWAAVLGLATTIAGVYGMNFALVPKDQTLFGFWFAIGMIVISCTALWLYFKHKKWF